MARAILHGRLLPLADVEELRHWRIFLPTRRAARALAVALLEQLEERRGKVQACLLPRILPLGDVDEGELSLVGLPDESMSVELLPAPAAELPRLFLLCRLMMEWAERQQDAWPLPMHLREHSGAALRLARSLARLVDSFENEELELDELRKLLDEERPLHRLAARDLLEYLREHFPRLLQERGLMGAARRRARLIRMQAERLARENPRTPVIAAGSTGSLPATAHLLSVISRLPHGAVVLPGLDADMDERSWRALEPGHPQFGMRLLLERMKADRGEVEELARVENGDDDAGHDKDGGDGDEGWFPSARRTLLREVMRPAATTDAWKRALADQRDAIDRGIRGMRLLMAESRGEEARAIALLMREVLETPGRTCMLITPDRTLARAVRAELRRWDVDVDDSAGVPLLDTPPGNFLVLLAQAALDGFAPSALAALMAHPFFCAGMERREMATLARLLQLVVLRPLERRISLDELPGEVSRRRRQARRQPLHEHPNVRALDDARWRDMERVATLLARRLGELEELFASGRRGGFARMLRCFLETAEELATPPEGECLLWRARAGEELATTLAEVVRHADDAPAMRGAELVAFLVSELAARPVRQHQPAHARLSILGLLEARMMDADRVILGGLNEGIWPEEALNDPWLNRTDRAALKLPLPERRIGLSAHDFTQAASRREVWLTCAAKIEQQPAVPSRWILRLRAVLQAAGLSDLEQRDRRPLDWARMLDRRAPPQRIAPPFPAPPTKLRPLHVSASRVKTLLRDPYAIFASDILRLSPLPSLSADGGPALFGTMVHDALERFARRHPGARLPEDAEKELLELLREAHERHMGDVVQLARLEGRLARMAEWFVDREREWRRDVLRVHVECRGRMKVNAGGVEHVLSARADRLDVLRGGGVRLMDYKTGQPPSFNMKAENYDPQLDLEAAMISAGAFPDLPDEARKVAQMMFVRLSGGAVAGETRTPRDFRGTVIREPSTRARVALEGLKRLLAAWRDPATAYLPVSRPDRERRAHDYDHLSRWREWLPELNPAEGAEQEG